MKFQLGFSILRIALGVLLGATTLAGPAGARDPHWRSFGPGGGTVTGLASDPRDPQIVYAAVSQGLFASRDGGQTWRGFPLPPPVFVVAVAPSRPATLYAGGSKISRSGDGGRTWKTVLDESGLEIRALAVTPGQRPVVFALSQSTLLRSADDGRTWTTPFTSETQAGSLAVDPVTPGVAYVADGTGVFRSADSGATWTRVLDLDGTVLVAVAPSSPRTLYAVASRTGPAFSVYRSGDSGQTWSKIRDREGSYDRALVIDPGSPEKLYLAGLNGLLGSFDGGRIWIPLDTGMPKDLFGGSPGVFALAVASRQRRTIFAGLDELGVARSDNSGGIWSVPVQTGLAAVTYSSVFFNPGRPEEAFVVLDSRGDRWLRSTDDGSTWSFLPRRVARLGVHSMAFDAADPARFYAATDEGVWKTPDDGRTWFKLSEDRFYKVATAGPGVLLASSSCGLSRSLDGGLTWKVALPCAYDDSFSQRVIDLWVDPSAPDAIYAFMSLFTETRPYSSLILKSTDRGATWRQLPLSNPDLFLVAPGDSRVLYARQNALDGGGLERSQDGGGTWQVVNQRPVAGDELSFSLAVDVQDPDTIYLSTFRRLLRSRDGGRTLEVIDSAFDGGSVFTDRARPGFLFEHSYQGGLFELQVE
ncbi:MAG TPA: hypothetical protein VGS07_29030 [Thermoanaerobaculia bacterium]|nr:hypothetical protein [Thermoanaerobaculia bacterium]